MTFLRLDPNLAVVVQGVILIGVVMVGSLVQLRRQRGMSEADRQRGAAEPVADRWPAGGACSATGRSSRCSSCS